MHNQEIFISNIDTPLGAMLAAADANFLYALLFKDEPLLEQKIKKLALFTNMVIKEGKTPITRSISSELHDYFAAKLFSFKTPIKPCGSIFQLSVWRSLCNIPHGQTSSYEKLAMSIEKPTACRAVANANGKNRLAIIVPCHRVINKSGALGGYSSGLSKKEWLLKHEKAWSRL